MEPTVFGSSLYECILVGVYFMVAKTVRRNSNIEAFHPLQLEMIIPVDNAVLNFTVYNCEKLYAQIGTNPWCRVCFVEIYFLICLLDVS